MEPSEYLNLLNMNSLGEPDPQAISKHDLLSAISFDKRGNFLSVGDRGGRVIVFERKEEKGVEDFDYFTEFQSHTK
jgi:serine/threonine-protein phosphatase 2A regulatory subunit B